MESSEDTEIEMKLFNFGETMLFQVPPATSRGHCASEWKAHFVWKGKMEIVMKGAKCKVTFRSLDGSVYGYGFIIGNVNKQIETCYDSSRYFAIRLLNEENKSLLMGIGFDDRNVAFDFKQSLLKFQKNVEYDSKPAVDVSMRPKQDFSLKEGEQIVLNMAGVAPAQFAPKASQGVKKLAPPPGSKGLAKPPSSKPETKKEGKESPLLDFFCINVAILLSLIHICRCRRLLTCRSRWSPYH
eukprot:TRINITY_DN11820_c0_g1_i4.p1 TRINITY_DN11820_c0_g1~~TRINITY_DN11820_c0_g1_i4.p1  ORF type:complete len:241 (+),score=65.59 TRINITY_DN11820_c0_g1_i4:68-790(+)